METPPSQGKKTYIYLTACRSLNKTKEKKEKDKEDIF